MAKKLYSVTIERQWLEREQADMAILARSRAEAVRLAYREIEVAPRTVKWHAQVPTLARRKLISVDPIPEEADA